MPWPPRQTSTLPTPSSPRPLPPTSLTPVITQWDRAVHRDRTTPALLIHTPTELPDALVGWAVGAAREFYAPLVIGAVVRESPSASAPTSASATASAIAAVAGVAVAAASPAAVTI